MPQIMDLSLLHLPKRHFASWDRGYRCHIYRRDDGMRVGIVKLLEDPGTQYVWETAGCRGSCASLVVAKRCVEQAVNRRLEQFELFAR